jgi:hypothetical protein
VSLVDSIKSVQGAVTQAFDQLVSDVEAEESSTIDPGTGAGPSTVDKITVTYVDGSTVDFAPTDGVNITPDSPEVKDMTGEAPVEGEKSEQEPPQATPPGDTQIPGNAEQV